MADEATDISSEEELSVYARWLENNKPVEHAKDITAKGIASDLCTFLESKCTNLENMHGLGFDGASTMSGHRTGVQTRLRLHSPSAICIHCRCHQLHLAALNAASAHIQVKRVLGTLLTVWKAFHYSPKKAQKLAEIQAELNTPEIKMQKPSDTRWLSRERAVRAVQRSLPALVNTFEEIYNDTGDAEVHGIATLLTKYNTVACIFMLSDVLHTVAKLQGSLQGKEIDLASVPAMIESTTKWLKELKESPKSSTWFKEHCLVFSDRTTQLGMKEIEVTGVMKTDFEQNGCRPYFQSVVNHINGRMESTDLISSMSVFYPCQHPGTEKELTESDYGMEKIKKLTSFYGCVQKM